MPNRTRSARQLSSTKRGYDGDHKANRTRLLNLHLDGSPCWWCNLPMFRDRTKNYDYEPGKLRSDGQPDLTTGELAADHERTIATHGVGRTKANRLMHGLCNKRRGDGTRDHLRPALTHVAGEDSPLGILVMDWPA